MDEPPPHPDPVFGPVPEESLDELPLHPDPVPVPEVSQAEPPSHFVPVREGLLDDLPPLPAPVPGPVLEGSEDELPPSLVSVPEEFVEDLSPLPVPVPEGARMHPLCLLCLGGSAADLHGLAKGPSGLRTAPLSSTVGSPGHAAGCQIISSYVASLLSSYVADMHIAGSAGDGLRAGRLNSGSVGDGRLNSGSVMNSCPPSDAPSTHPGRMFVLFLFCGRLGSALKGRGYVMCVEFLSLCFCNITWSGPLFSVSLHPKPTPVLCFPLIVWSRLSLVPPAVQFCI
ncbi:hypothetical protein XENOCAPTIV_008157 [Xenoophorus captivus]|uniref:Uncharacterized protein n=1 Tax=Xenoophorus captivus TaxID=1517983 RepID=A0ABV0R3D0_9TELE